MSEPFIWTTGEQETELWHGNKCLGIAWKNRHSGWSWISESSGGGLIQGGARDKESAKGDVIRWVCS